MSYVTANSNRTDESIFKMDVVDFHIFYSELQKEIKQQNAKNLHKK